MRLDRRYACITLDLEPDHAGLIPERYDLWKRKNIKELLNLLRTYGVPLTVFVVGKALRDRPDIVRTFLQYKTEFHLHSQTHTLANTDGSDEISTGKNEFKHFFGYPPRGYRAPQGRMSREGLVRLEREGFIFDASIFPSFWPTVRYVLSPNHPYLPIPAKHIVEVPFTTITPFRLVLSLSWMKLLGWPLYQVLLDKFPLRDIIFGMHLHDFWVSPASANLPWQWQLVYRRNREHGHAILREFIVLLRERRYRFITVADLVRRYQKLQRSNQ